MLCVCGTESLSVLIAGPILPVFFSKGSFMRAPVLAFPLGSMLLGFILLLNIALAAPACARLVTDMRGKRIPLPNNLTRVATIDDGFVEGVMTHLGVIDAVDMIGSWSMKRDYKYAFEAENGESWEWKRWKTFSGIHPMVHTRETG